VISERIFCDVFGIDRIAEVQWFLLPVSELEGETAGPSASSLLRKDFAQDDTAVGDEE
jgi:hypothetical protein